MDIELIEVMVCLAIVLTIAAFVPEWYFSWKRKRRLKKRLLIEAKKLEGEATVQQVNKIARTVWNRSYNLLTFEERMMLQRALRGKI